MKPAPFGRRYLAFLLDIVVLEILGALVTAPLVNRSHLDLFRVLLGWISRGTLDQEGFQLVAFYGLLLGILWSLYFIGFTGACGQTPGKKALGLIVTREDGESVGWTAAFVRCCIGYPISLLPLGVGFYWAAFAQDHQAWHDKIAGTRVMGPAIS